MAADLVLAHYGGAPEALTVALPLAIFVGFMALERRARRREREGVDADGASGPEPRSGTQPAGDDA